MLVLTRRLGDKIRIGTDIWITVVEIDRGKVRIGFEAPPGVGIFREELLNDTRDAPPGDGSV